MNRIPIFVGLDYHQDLVQVCVIEEGGQQLSNRGCANSWLAIKEHAERFGIVKRVAIESCSGAADLADDALFDNKTRRRPVLLLERADGIFYIFYRILFIMWF